MKRRSRKWPVIELYHGNERKPYHTVPIPPTHHAALLRAAKDQGITPNAMVKEIMMTYVGLEEKRLGLVT